MPHKTLAYNRLSLNNKDDFQICTTTHNYACNVSAIGLKHAMQISSTPERLLTLQL